MKVKAIKEFKDLKENKIRKPGDVFEVNKDRFNELENHWYAPLVVEVKEPEKNDEPKVDKKGPTEEEEVKENEKEEKNDKKK